MKNRRILLTGILSLAVIAAFGFSNQSKPPGLLSRYVGGVCINFGGNPDQANCSVTFTGPQCTWQGALVYEAELSTTPSCSKPLRQPF